ncbi:MAG TPA: CoA transferase [Galbitalea sp.]|nr:CoA transferase [Galbitalea sp.]
MTTHDEGAGYLGGIRVLEIGNELGEYCGKVLAGLGADVVRVEPPGGETTRSYGPFYHDEPNPNRSLYFWHYNLGKRGIVLDLDDDSGRRDFVNLAASADVVLDSRPRSYLADRGLGYEQLASGNPRLVYARISPFGDSGPWSDLQASDLIHLALGGMMMNCGYDADPSGFYETPPIAPQMWHAYHIAGEMTAMSIVTALVYRLTSGRGQRLSTSVHEAVSKNTETDMPDWIFLHQAHRRLTCRHSMVSASGPALSITKDGRYLLPYRTYLRAGTVNAWDRLVALLKKHNAAADLDDPKYLTDYRYTAEAAEHMTNLIDRLVLQNMYARDLWVEAQSFGLPWAPIRRPEENIGEAHWQARGAFAKVHHPELNETFAYPGARWLDTDTGWQVGARAPLVGEHTEEVAKEWPANPVRHVKTHRSSRDSTTPLLSRRNKPFALSNVRVIDLSWMLASAGAGRFLSAWGAEVIKVEHDTRWDGMRFGLGLCPPGGRDERDRATEALPTPDWRGDPNRGGSFMEINAGKLGIALNLKHPTGRKYLEDLIRDADIVVEGFSPGTMERMGFGYDRLKELNPSIIYVQQSGFGDAGLWGQTRAYGPSAAALSGISDMSGLPEPFPPAGIGYSYLDWFGAYNAATAMVAALYRREISGKGCHIDASQAEIGIYLTGTAVLDYSVNRRRWSRYGNRSPYKQAAPHGAYRASGEDRWIAIAAFTEQHWRSVADVLSHPEWVYDKRFANLAARLVNQDDLDALVDEATQRYDRFVLMDRLQAAGVPAGVCQTSQDRYETDPQLAHLGWLVELEQTTIGRWPVKDLPTQMSETPSYIGGPFDRSGPTYDHDTDEVLSRILHLSDGEIADARRQGALSTFLISS